MRRDRARSRVIDPATRTVTATVPIGENVSALAVDSGTGTLYVTNENDGRLYVIERR